MTIIAGRAGRIMKTIVKAIRGLKIEAWPKLYPFHCFYCTSPSPPAYMYPRFHSKSGFTSNTASSNSCCGSNADRKII